MFEELYTFVYLNYQRRLKHTLSQNYLFPTGLYNERITVVQQLQNYKLTVTGLDKT